MIARRRGDRPAREPGGNFDVPSDGWQPVELVAEQFAQGSLGQPGLARGANGLASARRHKDEAFASGKEKALVLHRPAECLAPGRNSRSNGDGQGRGRGIHGRKGVVTSTGGDPALGIADSLGCRRPTQ